jgi:tetratricopeptide (TPR) repeat protein
MTRMLVLLAVSTSLSVASAANAQFGQGGITIQYSGKGLKTGVFVPVGPGGVLVNPPVFGSVERRVFVQKVIVGPPPRPLAPDYDLSGIDLDIYSPDRLYPAGTAPAPRKAEALLEPKKAPEMPRSPAPLPKPEVPAPPAKPSAAEESQRLMELGKQAFREQEYGLAAMRFRQASELDGANARAFFLLAQAYLAVGQYRDAVQSIEEGLKLDPDWPACDFRPRLELYTAADDWIEHRARLNEAVKRQPKDASFAFLRAYAAWFDGDRPQAVTWFLAARALSPDPRWVDLFLKHAAAPVVAAG